MALSAIMLLECSQNILVSVLQNYTFFLIYNIFFCLFLRGDYIYLTFIMIYLIVTRVARGQAVEMLTFHMVVLHFVHKDF